MLKSLGSTPFSLRLGRRLCVCLPNHRLEAGLRTRIRPWVIAGLAFWCDKADAR